MHPAKNLLMKRWYHVCDCRKREFWIEMLSNSTPCVSISCSYGASHEAHNCQQTAFGGDMYCLDSIPTKSNTKIEILWL